MYQEFKTCLVANKTSGGGLENMQKEWTSIEQHFNCSQKKHTSQKDRQTNSWMEQAL
jgi:hypothetical protein